MNILKHGDPERIKAKKQFICYSCGCEFEADRGEYHANFEYFGRCYFCACPECLQVAKEVKKKR